MIFAHGPAGLLVSHLFLKKWYKKNSILDDLTKSKIIAFYLIGFIGGLFPDIDLFYYYLISAKVSHRDFFTHSLSVYLALFLIVLLIAYLTRNKFLNKSNIIFFVGVLTHLITDSIGYGVMWLYPFNKNLYGIANLSFIKNSFVTKYFFTVNYSLEVIILFCILFIIIAWFIKSEKIKFILYIISLVLCLSMIVGLFFVNQHLFISNSDGYYDDTDSDGVINKEDRDIDNDKILNINDNDINNNGISNQEEMQKLADMSIGVYYDLTNGGFLEIPLRMGFVTNSDLIRRLYDNIGIYFRAEMEQDYQNNYSDYKTSPDSKSFDREPENWKAWLKHNKKLLSQGQTVQAYDILFFNDNYVALALSDGYILEADPQKKKVNIVSIDDIISRKGNILNIGRILP